MTTTYMNPHWRLHKDATPSRNIAYWSTFNWMTKWKKRAPGVRFVVTITSDGRELTVHAGLLPADQAPHVHVLFTGTAPDVVIEQLEPYISMMVNP